GLPPLATRPSGDLPRAQGGQRGQRSGAAHDSSFLWPDSIPAGMIESEIEAADPLGEPLKTAVESWDALGWARPQAGPRAGSRPGGGVRRAREGGRRGRPRAGGDRPLLLPAVRGASPPRAPAPGRAAAPAARPRRRLL